VEGVLPEPRAFIDGESVAARDLAISIYDAGFVLGATVTEQLRTFRGQLFRLDDHLQRLFRSLEILDIDPGYSADALRQIATDLVHHNRTLIDKEDDLGMGIFVTPGTYATFTGIEDTSPTVCLYTYPLPYHLWANKYQQGDALVISDVLQIPPGSWPAELKCRSRMHYFLADRRARAVDPHARAVLLDDAGFVTETSTANIALVYATEGIVSPRAEKILPGISLKTLSELAEALQIPFIDRDVHPEEFFVADEVMLASTSICLLPVVRCDGQPIGSGRPGPVYRKLLAAWNQQVGVDLPGQAAKFGDRPCR